MAKIERLRIGIDIIPDDPRYAADYEHMASSPDGITRKVLEACHSYYYPIALMEKSADPSEILKAATLSVNHLHHQIQLIVGLLQASGIQPTPLTLAQAGMAPSFHSLSPPAQPLAILPENENTDEWSIPELSPAELAYQAQSRLELGLD
jgi:hypothetical protein